MENLFDTTPSSKRGETSVPIPNNNSEDKNKSKTPKKFKKIKTPFPATISISGVISIQNANNVQFGHTINQSKPFKLAPPEPKIENDKSLLSLLASNKEIVNQHRITVSSQVGSNWRQLGYELGGFSNSQMDQLEEKFKAEIITFDEMTYQLILKWEDHSEIQPTVGRLAKALLKCKMNSALLAMIALEGAIERRELK